jgi:hypothetical protein
MVMVTLLGESRYNVNGTLVAAHGGVATPWNSGLFRVVASCPASPQAHPSRCPTDLFRFKNAPLYLYNFKEIKMSRIVLPLILLIMLGLTGCAETSYQEMQGGSDYSYGYYDKRLSDDKFIVGYKGHTMTTSDIVNDYAIMRAAEIGSTLGFQYFAVIGKEDKTKTVVTDYGTTTTTEGKARDKGDKIKYKDKTYTSKNQIRDTYPIIELTVQYFSRKPQKKYLRLYPVSGTYEKIQAKHAEKK